MLKFLDKIWCWHGWMIIKWPFGVVLLVFILYQIWYLETVPEYDKKLAQTIRESAPSLSTLKSYLPTVEYDFFNRERMLK